MFDYGKISYFKIDDGNFGEHSLNRFDFCQKVEKCWRKKDGRYILTAVNYTDDRNLSERKQTALKILKRVNSGSVAVAAESEGDIIGFALIDTRLFGSERQYADLSEFYISAPFRRLGIGRKLFDRVCRAAKTSGAKKLYISAHSAKESIAAYKSYGCVLAAEPDGKHIMQEPCDLQLEYDLSPRIYKAVNKDDYKSLLLLADEQWSMVERYLDNSDTFIIEDCGVKGEITVTDVGNGILEIKNLAVYPQFKRLGYGKKLIDFISEKYKDAFSILQAGTGDSPLTVPFYEKCGFTRARVVKHFFTENYDLPIIEAGVVLDDMIYLTKKL